jgi:HSP20 family protein
MISRYLKDLKLPKISKATSLWIIALFVGITASSGITYLFTKKDKLSLKHWHIISPAFANDKEPKTSNITINKKTPSTPTYYRSLFNDPFFDNWGSSLNDPFAWDPFREMEIYRRRMQRAFNDLSSSQNTHNNIFYNPQLSLEEAKENYTVKVDLPGLEKDTINIELENNLLTISGKREVSKESKNDQGFYRSERSYGAFSRSITLPEDIKEDEINADYKNGVLIVQIPRKTSDRPSKKKIQIN